MSNSSSSSSSSKTKKEAQSALDRFKMEVASEIGVNLKEGYNGDLTSAEAGSVGGNMVKKMIRKQEEQMSSGN
ncbi:MAG: alpha/beta-type small acid-soluble spore protein [Lachnospira sp.]|nr:alpha/beta-type small acid-soluble spore protein [Lachnospira sp.]